MLGAKSPTVLKAFPGPRGLTRERHPEDHASLPQQGTIKKAAVARPFQPSSVFSFFLGAPPRGVPGEGPDCRFPQEIGVLGPIPTRIWG